VAAGGAGEQVRGAGLQLGQRLDRGSGRARAGAAISVMISAATS